MRLTTALAFLLLSTAALEPVEAQQYVISTVAGVGIALPPTPVRGVDLSIAPSGITTDAVGNAYFTTFSPYYVFKLDQNGIVTRIAGNSRSGYSGDGGPATSAQLNAPVAIAVDGAGNLFVADRGNNRIRKISPSGIITTVAGNGTLGFSGDGGPATSAQFGYLQGLAVDGAGNLFIADSGNNRVRKVSPSGIIATVAGNGSLGFSGDGGPATSAQLNNPWGVAVDGAGNLYIADSGNQRVRKVSPGGIITTVVGNGARGGLSGDGGPATSAQVSYLQGLAVNGAGNLFIVDPANRRVRKVSTDGIIITVAGNGTDAFVSGFSGDGGPATSAQLNRPNSVAVDAAGNLFIGDSGNNRVRKVSPSGIITTVAGNGTSGYSGDGGPATSAQMSDLAGIAVDGAGNLFIGDNGNHRVRKVSPTGIITTVAGNGTFAYSGDGGPATSAALGFPSSVAVDAKGNLFIGDYGDYRSRVRKVTPEGVIVTVAGGGSEPLDGGPATSAGLFYISAVAVDRAGNLFIATSNPNMDDGVSSERIHKVSPDGIITTIAGTGTVGFSGDGGPATSAQLSGPSGIAVDEADNLFIVDSGNHSIRKVSPGGIITTVARDGIYDWTGVAVDGAGNVYIADTGNHVVRVLRPSSGPVINAVVDAASQSANPISPGKIVVLYGLGLGPAELVQNQPDNGLFGTAVGGTAVSFNGIAAPVLYASATQVAAVAPYALVGTTAQVTVSYQGQASAAFAVPVAASAPSLFTVNETGAGQAAAINAVDGTVNSAANPVKIGGFISLYATGEGQTVPAGVDGRLGGSAPTSPILPVSVTVGGIPATVQYKGGAQGLVAGLIQINVQIPDGVQPGGYVPVVFQVGDRSSGPAVWIAVGN